MTLSPLKTKLYSKQQKAVHLPFILPVKHRTVEFVSRSVVWRRVWRDKEGNAMIIGTVYLDWTWKLNKRERFFFSRKNTNVEFEKKYLK